MGRQIKVIFDPAFKHDPLHLPIAEPTPDQIDSYETKHHEIDQTKVYGIEVPLIAINDIFIDFDNIIDFSLKSIDMLPSLKMTVIDKYGLIEGIQTPGIDNTIRVDILPRFENAYKKIELAFYINNMNINGNCITLSGIYKLPALTDTRFESFGEINTYDIFQEVAKNTKLGFASNVMSDYDDSRYVYCDFKSYIDILNREVVFGGNENEIYNYWVDFWNYIVLQDIKERYYTIDSDDEMLVWVAKQVGDTQDGSDIEVIKTVALITNHPSMSTAELYARDFDLINKSGDQIYKGNDRVYSIYEDAKWEHRDYNVIDGDIKHDVYTKFDYIGETYSQHNYLKQRCIRSSFLQKVNSESIKVKLNYPLLGLNRGDKVNFIWYTIDDADSARIGKLEEAGVIPEYEDIRTNIPLTDSYEDVNNPDNGIPLIDRAVSGQYLITAVNLIYNDNRWTYELTLNRPADQKPKIINEK